MPTVIMTPELAAATERRAARIHRERSDSHHRWTDRLFGCLLVVQWLAASAAALWISPRTWIGAEEAVHMHVWLAVGGGGIACIFPAWLIVRRPGSVATRHAVALAQMFQGSILIAVTGGRIETHFHVFGSLAFLAFYRDWRVLVTASAFVLVDHAARGIFWPQSIFGVIAASPWRWVEHAAWVVFIDVFLLTACVRGERLEIDAARAQAEAEVTRDGIERIVTDRTRELERAREEAEAATRSKSAFLANMSHEIRTPMTAILGYTELLGDPGLVEADRREHIRTIRRNGEHLLEVINDILDVSKIESGHMSVDLASCSPCRIVADVAALMRVRAAARGLALDVHYAFPVPERVESDALRLRQILLNLLGNAIKFTDRGGVRLVVRFSRIDADRGDLAFDVIDSGIGMNDEQLALLFRPFSQVNDSASRRHGGTGLGLAISQRLAHLLNGEITVRSDPGRGSTFTLVMRLVGLGSVPMVNSPSEAFADAGRPEDAASDPVSIEARILLAEDGPDNQRLIAHLLRRAGAEVDVADNGRVALDAALDAAAAGRPYDVILMDIQMPEMDGIEATAALRNAGYRGPIIALTAHAMEGFRDKCLQFGCDDYASKPIDRRQLMRTIARCLEASSSRVVVR